MKIKIFSEFTLEGNDWASSWRFGDVQPNVKEWVVQGIRRGGQVIRLNDRYALHAGDAYGCRLTEFRISGRLASYVLKVGDRISFNEPMDHEGLIHNVSSININGTEYPARVVSGDGPETYLYIAN